MMAKGEDEKGKNREREKGEAKTEAKRRRKPNSRTKGVETRRQQDDQTDDVFVVEGSKTYNEKST
jgi:hypothetical protein